MNTRKWLVVSATTLALLLSPVAVTQAQTGGGFDLTWNTMDGGGQMNLSGGSYTLKGSIGQPDAGTHVGGHYWLGGGFWKGGGVLRVFVPLLRKR